MQLSNKIPFIAGNWKMYMTNSEAVALVNNLQAASQGIDKSEMVVIPPYTAIQELTRLLVDSPLQVGAQNLHWEDKGAFTGEISAAMLKDIGCTYVVIGHSERRQLFGETDETVNMKIKTALTQGLYPILCVGETIEEREAGSTISKVESQIVKGMAGLEKSQAERVILAYEPIWAIGTGLTATPDQAQEVHSFIRNMLTKIYGNETASCAIILYGGSVKPDNAFVLLKEKDINGALVGGASLKPESFIDITKESIRAYKEKK
ncbi:triose-phosphate isomerase [Acidobacteriota bacterium]